MKIPFVFTFAGDLPRAIANRLVKSIKRVMPNSYIFQQTDTLTDAIGGCEVIRIERGPDFAEFFLRHLKELDLPRFIKIDYDCVVQKDLAPLFEGRWQVGLTRRDEADKTLSEEMAIRQPYNNGVIFSNGKHSFFNEVYDRYMAIPDRDGWMDAQEAVREAAGATRTRLEEFPCSIYNYTPSMPDEDLSDKYIVHYKGMRKHWALDTADMLGAMREGQRVGGMVRRWMAERLK